MVLRHPCRAAIDAALAGSYPLTSSWATDVKNILSIDLEEWDQLAYRRVTGRLPAPTGSVARQLEALLALLQEQHAKATFFVLGMMAERHPALVRRVAEEGHEIACHGYSHLVADKLERGQFREDAERAKKLLEDVIGVTVQGYRAAEFSIRRQSLWALEVLAELGFRYDSSIFPIHHRRYGIADFSPQVARLALPNGLKIIELPLATTSFAGWRLPVAGGGYFRLMPQWLIRSAVRRVNRGETPVVTYFHPYEFDPQRLDVFRSERPASWGERLRGLEFNFHQNLRRRSIPGKVAALLKEFPFTTCRDYLDETPPGERELA